MSDLNILLRYFPELSPDQIGKFSQLGPLYKSWNEKINLVSRQDISQLYLRHVLHSLAIAKFITFPHGCKVLDVGTGGGFPGIPLAILFPDTHFTLVDSIAKKIMVVKDVAEKTEAVNIRAINARAETLKDKYDFVVSRAVTGMPRFVSWVRPLFNNSGKMPMPGGIIALKGGNLEEELGSLFKKAKIIPVSDYFEEDFFSTKKIVFLPIK